MSVTQVSTDLLASGSVTTPKIADDAVTNSKLGFDGGAFMFRNKIINGCGWIDQRNNNGSVTVNNTGNNFGPDRWAGFGQSADGVFTLTGTKSTWDANGKGLPSSIYATTTTADASIGATQGYGIRYVIEGQDVADWHVGTAQAALATLSFRVRSSKVGTHCVAIANAASDRTYVATYAVAQANTWEVVEIPIQMDTTGTWDKGAGLGIKLFWNLGAGSTLTAPIANAWQAGMYYAAAGCQNVIGTLNASLAITDVQFERGGVATPFENRPISAELSLCQRYYETGSEPYFYIEILSRANAYGEVRFATTKRYAPTVTATGWQYFSAGGAAAFTPTIVVNGVDRFMFQGTSLTNFDGWTGAGTWKADAEL